MRVESGQGRSLQERGHPEQPGMEATLIAEGLPARFMVSSHRGHSFQQE